MIYIIYDCHWCKSLNDRLNLAHLWGLIGVLVELRKLSLTISLQPKAAYKRSGSTTSIHLTIH